MEFSSENVGLIVLSLLAIVPMLFARRVRRSYVARPRPTRILILESSLDPLAVRTAILKALSILQAFKDSRLILEEDVPEQGLITLRTDVSMFGWGFFHPIWLEPLPGGGTRAVVGIESKLKHLGPSGKAVSNYHQEALAFVERAIAA